MSWYNEIGNSFDTVLSSRIRFARNIAGFPFSSRLKDEDAKTIISSVFETFEEKGFKKIDFSDISPLDASSYVEKHLVSREFAAKKTPHALLLSESTGTAIMLCEEDHVRLQSIFPGLALEEAYRVACEYDDVLGSALEISYDEELGYLTVCPTNLGTGMRASVMMFLPAITMAGGIRDLASQLSKIGLTMRGMYGEGSESGGCLYQISNQITLGITEEETLKKLSEVIDQISDRERKLRTSLKGNDLDTIRDRIMRSEGALKYAHMMSSSEFMQHFSNVRLGISMGIITDISYVTLGSLFVDTLPATLTKSESLKGSSERERDLARAKLIRARLL